MWEIGKHHSNDMVGQEVRDQLEESVAKCDPFNKRREKKVNILRQASSRNICWTNGRKCNKIHRK